MNVYTAAQMRAFDKAATEVLGIPSAVLMENAALRVVEFVEHKFGRLRGKRIAVLCGKGNNGGDGFAITRHLIAIGADVTVLMTAAPTEQKGDAAINQQILTKMGTCLSDTAGNLRIFAITDEFFHEWRPEWELISGEILVDALLGTGFTGEIRPGSLRDMLEFCSGLNPRPSVVAVDLPSGVNADTGVAANETLWCDYTVTFAGAKPGLFLGDGLERCGEIWVGDIGTTAADLEAEASPFATCINRDLARYLLPHRPIDSNKGQSGRVILCGGSYGMSGAPTLAARATLRSGAGLAIACLPDRIVPIFAAAFAEATSHPLACDHEGQLVPDAADALPDIWKNAQVVALGPGLSRSAGALEFARRVVRECPHPLVIDADALYALHAIAEDVASRIAPTVLTPHPGEMGELLQMKTAEVQADRPAAALAAAKKYNAIVVLKGSRSIVANPEGGLWFNLTGNSGMATGGAGDVLTGTVAGLIAQTRVALNGTLLAVYAHGLAGDIAHRTRGVGLIAGDIADALPAALLEIKNETTGEINPRLRLLA